MLLRPRPTCPPRSPYYPSSDIPQREPRTSYILEISLLLRYRLSSALLGDFKPLSGIASRLAAPPCSSPTPTSILQQFVTQCLQRPCCSRHPHIVGSTSLWRREPGCTEMSMSGLILGRGCSVCIQSALYAAKRHVGPSR